MKKLAFTSSLLAIAAFSQASILVDSFADSEGSYTSGYISSGIFVATNVASGAIGNTRQTYLEILGNPSGEDARIRVSTTNSRFIAAAGPDLTSKINLNYGTEGDLNTSFVGNTMFNVNFLTNDLPLSATLVLRTGAGTTSFGPVIVGANLSPFTYSFDISTYANLADVDGIGLNFLNTAGGDFIIDSVEAVPEPATMAVLGLGAAALLRRRKK